MQPDQVEVAFCDLCGSSVPEGDFANNTAIRFQGKTIGACCTGQLRGATAAPAVAGDKPASAPGAHDPRLVPVAIAVLAAVAAATIFLDYRIATSEQHRADAHRETTQLVRADREAIARIDVAMDGAARRADLEALGEKLTTVVDGSGRDAARANERFEVLQKDLANLQRDVRAAAAAGVDYRPFFDEVRQQMQRQATVLAELRTAAAAPTPAAPVEASNPPPVDPGANNGGVGNAPDALPAALVEHANKLRSNDAAVRFEAVDALLRSKDPLVLPHLLPVAKDPDVFVRRLVLQGLRDHKRGDVVETLIAALVDTDENVTDAAWKSLIEVTGQKLPFEPTASKDARARAQKKWQDWWDKNKATFGS